MDQLLIPLITGTMLLFGVGYCIHNISKSKHYTTCIVTTMLFTTLAIGQVICHDYKIINKVNELISDKPGSKYIIIALFLFAAYHLYKNYRAVFQSSKNIELIIFIVLAISATSVLATHKGNVLATALTLCLVFVVGFVHGIIGPIISAYTLATILVHFWNGVGWIDTVFAGWPAVFDFLDIRSALLKTAILVLSALLGFFDDIYAIAN